MRTAFEEEGDVRSVDIPVALASLWRESATGVLRFSRPGQDIRIDLAEGEVVGISSSDPTLETTHVLVRAGKLDPAVLEDRRLSGAEDRSRTARDLGLLSDRDWRWGEKIRAIEILADLVTWLGGEYTLSRAETPRAGEFRLGIQRLLLELYLRSGDREFVHRSLGATDSRLQRADDFDDRFPSLGLTSEADLVVAAIDGRTTAADISRRVPPDPFSVERLLAAMTTLGLVHPEYATDRPRPRGRKAAPPPGRQEPETVPPPPAPVVPPPVAPPAEIEPPAVPEPVPVEIPEPEQPVELPLAEPVDVVRPEAVPTGWDQAPVDTLDAPLALPEPPELMREPVRRGRPALWLLFVLAAAVAALLVWRAREYDDSPISVAGVTPPPVATVELSTPSVTAIAATPFPGVAITGVAPAVDVPVSPTGAPPPTLAPSPVPPTPTVAEEPSPVPTAMPTAPPGPPASGIPTTLPEWVARAGQDRATLAADGEVQYTIQLELVCELRSVRQAWDYDRGGAMWLLDVPFGQRTCFRVFWGRYRTFEEASRALASDAPRFFFTRTNHPVVVSARSLLR